MAYVGDSPSPSPVLAKVMGILQFLTWRARLRYILGGVEMIKEGYEKVTEHHRAYHNQIF